MKCEGRTADCRRETGGRSFELFDYCEHCSKNLCGACMTGRCSKSPSGRHAPANHGGDE